MSYPCRDFEQQIIDLVLGVLSTPDQLHIQEHLHECGKCRTYYEGLRSLDKDLGRQLGAGTNMSDQIEKIIQKLNQLEAPQDKCEQDRNVHAGKNWRRIAAILLIVGGLIFNIIYFLYTRGDLPVVNMVKPDENRQYSAVEKNRLTAEKKMADDFLAQGNILALGTLLETGLPETKILTADYLGRIGNTSSIHCLQNFANQWPKDGSENPYQKAIDEIQKRLTPSPQPQ